MKVDRVSSFVVILSIAAAACGGGSKGGAAGPGAGGPISARFSAMKACAKPWDEKAAGGVADNPHAPDVYPKGPYLAKASAPTPPPKSKVTVTGDQITIAEKVLFQSNSAEIDPQSNSLLDEVAGVMKEHAEIDLVEVDGHADARGNAAANVDLTRRRAASVVKYLVAQGVAGARLRAQGLGSYCPLDPAKTDDAYEKNRRVEFHIVRRAATEVPPGWGGCPEATKHGIKPPSVAPPPSPTPATPAAPATPASAPPAPTPPAATDACTTDLDVNPTGHVIPKSGILRPFDAQAPWQEAGIEALVDVTVKAACAARPASFERLFYLQYALSDQMMLVVNRFVDGSHEQAVAGQRAINLADRVMAEVGVLPADEELTDVGRSMKSGAAYNTWSVYAAYGFFDLAKAAWAIGNPHPSSYLHPVEILWLEAKADPSKAAANMPLIEETLAYTLSLGRKCSDDNNYGNSTPIAEYVVAAHAVGKTDKARAALGDLLACPCNRISTGMLDAIPKELLR
jgi:outer membrane protein OmpA-like peptidoglycan-associated protein